MNKLQLFAAAGAMSLGVLGTAASAAHLHTHWSKQDLALIENSAREVETIRGRLAQSKDDMNGHREAAIAALDEAARQLRLAVAKP